MKIKEYLLADDTHHLYVERIGDTTQPTILFNHGGPGLGFSEKDKAFFDFDRCNVIFYDQRGCKRSTPKGELQANQTQLLIEDINKLITHFGINKVILFGGSWGATLSLLFTLKYPHKIHALILRGLFLASKSSRRYYEQGGTQSYHPNAWNRLKAFSKVQADEEVFPSYFDGILQEKENIEQLALEFSLYGAAINFPEVAQKTLKQQILAGDYVTKAKIQSHYSSNDFFISDDFMANNIKKIGFIPIHIVHGKNDHITRIEPVRALAKTSPNIELIETREGHLPSSPENKKQLQKLLGRYLR